MKNIHILPTDKPSYLYENIKGKLGFNKGWDIIPFGRLNQHIYITDEEITGFENNIWVYNNGRVWLWQNTMALISNNKPRKIILTTDQSLNGVQAIDDEFLEWFVKNPSCEEVEVQCRYNFYAGKDLTHYKIIIPKEETKQEIKKQ